MESVTSVSPKPVMNDRAAGLNPTLPVTAEVGTLDINDPARMTNPPEVLRLTASCSVVCTGTVRADGSVGASSSPEHPAVNSIIGSNAANAVFTVAEIIRFEYAGVGTEFSVRNFM
jgi:hypothetical protein